MKIWLTPKEVRQFRDWSTRHPFADFKEDWDNAVARLEDTTRGLGKKAAAAATTMAEHDAGLAAAYQGG